MNIPSQDKFTGNPDDLAEFIRLADTPVRSPERSEALARWRAYKQQRLADICRREIGPLRKGWNMSALRRHLIDLSGAQLDGICLGYADLRGVKLDGASMRGAWLKGVEFEWASLRGVDFSELDCDPAPLGSAVGNGPARLIEANLRFADLGGAILTGADLSESSLIGANLDGADMTGARVYGVSAWDVALGDDSSGQRNLVVTREYLGDVRVDDIEFAQFFYLLMNHRKLRNAINAVTDRGVLILGRFADGGLATLQAIAQAVRDANFVPMLFDFDRPDDRDYTETVQTLAGLSRFAIVDLSGPSVPQELMATVPSIEIPYIPILRAGQKPHSMFRDLTKYSWLHPEVLYFDSVTNLCERLPAEVYEPAEKILARKRERLGIS